MTTSVPRPDPRVRPSQRSAGQAQPAASVRRRNRLVEDHRDLVRPVAVHYARRCPENLEDLQQVGLLGLIRAAELYQRQLGTPFPAFARPHIRGAILHYLRDEAPAVRLPRRQAELQERLIKLVGDADDTAGGRVIGRQLGIDEKQWHLLMRQRRLCRPLPLEEAPEESLGRPEEEPEQERLVAIRKLVPRLDPRQREVLLQVVIGGWSYRRLAARMQVSPMTVQRLLHRALAELRSQLEQLEEREIRMRTGCRAGSGIQGSRSPR